MGCVCFSFIPYFDLSFKCLGKYYYISIAIFLLSLTLEIKLNIPLYTLYQAWIASKGESIPLYTLYQARIASKGESIPLYTLYQAWIAYKGEVGMLNFFDIGIHCSNQVYNKKYSIKEY